MNSDLQQLVNDYHMSSEATAVVKTTPILLLVGVSGAGKDTIKHRLLEIGEYHHIVSHTTRLPRVNAGKPELDEVDYYFDDAEQVKGMLKAGNFVEAKVYSGNLYGTSITDIQKAHEDGKIAVTDIEVQGVAEYKAISDKVIAVFILPPNYDEWQRRLRHRYGGVAIDPEDMRRRMLTAISELEEALKQPYYHFVVNENLDEAVKAVNSIAHHHDEFTTIDRSFRVWAERLLAELRNDV